VKIRVFQSDKGDCLLVTSSDGKNLLADGGMAGSYRDHVAPFLGGMREEGEILDLVYVSHIDQDHIAGVLRMMDDAAAWKVHDFQVSHGNPNHREPPAPRPPEVRSIWHNSFHEQLQDNAGPIEEMLAADAAVLTLRSEAWALEAAETYANLAASKAEAVRLSRRIGERQLNIPLNQEYGGQLMFVTDPPESISLGTLNIRVIGPFAEDLLALRRQWNAWLRSRTGRRQIRDIRRRAREDERDIGQAEIDALLRPLFVLADQLGDRQSVTVPNLASLMLLVEEDGHAALMTGDGHGEDILWGLDACGKLDENGSIHVDVLKVQHHGSEHNLNAEFCRHVTANHYVFCGNGEHHNPDVRVVDAIIKSRLGSPSQRSENAQVGDPFKLWFNSSSAATRPDNRSHMRRLEAEVSEAADGSGGKMEFLFLEDDSSFVLDL
jgi:hypothetical protein